MVSVASCNEMEVVSGELEERAEDFSEDHMLNEAFSGPGLEITPGEDAQLLKPQQQDKEPITEEPREEKMDEKQLRVEDQKEDSGEEEKEGDDKDNENNTNNGEESLVKKREADAATQEGEDSEDAPSEDGIRLRKGSSCAKTVRFRVPSETDVVEEKDISEDSLFMGYETEEWTSISFEELFMMEDWSDITDDRLLRKKVLEPGPPEAPSPAWGQEVTLKMQGVLEDRMVVEKDCKLEFVIGEGDVNQALEECAISMRKDEIALLLADSQYTYGLLGREPDIPAWAPLLYQLQLVDFRDKPDPLDLPIPDRIRIGNQKRERGNFYFQREEYSMATRSYCMALDVLTTSTRDGRGSAAEEEEEVNDYRVKCLNNLAAAQLKLERYDEALHTCRDVLFLDPNNVKALFRTGKLLSDKGEYEEAMETLKKALKLEPTTKAIHAELSKLVKRQAGGNETQNWQIKPAQLFGDNIAPFVTPPKKKPSGISWKFLLGALVVALGSLVTSVVLTARN
ncbi:FKBP prolyl isomerase 16 [Denticeps clupeoides]|uniref:FKBP prolyl isomerase 16 n=1 Tax=Denticeps clupeoides TaxID=299321 RepID=UPI0010A33A80|nr:peptidyl-prolyl cis-trans isomerase FKBP8-like [Denticeps clupeoides]